MNNANVRKKFEEFINDPKYKKYFEDNETIALNAIIEIEKYMDDNKKRPPESTGAGKKLSMLIKSHKSGKGCVNIESVKNKFEQMINNSKYKKYFESKETYNINAIVDLDNFMVKNNRRPSFSSDDEIERQLASKLNTLLRSYRKNIECMKNTNIRTKFSDLLKKHSELFKNIDTNVVESDTDSSIEMTLKKVSKKVIKTKQ